MRIRAALWMVALTLAPVLLAGPAGADAPSPPDAKKGDNALDRADQEVKKAAKATKDALDRADRELKKAAKDAKNEVSKAFEEARAKLRDTRADRRAAERKEAREKWGALLARGDVQEELRLHARRSAYLDYIEKLADGLDRDQVRDRAKKARDMEDHRHDWRMEALKGKGGIQ